jgi:glucose/arabinose dehydrogenase
LGAILRIDVDGGEGGYAPECDAFDSGNYLIPPDNPFLDGPGGACGEIFLYGLRNPFRFSFDSATGDIYIADVGAENREEVNFLAAGSAGGQNFGWRCYEGTLPIFPEECPAPETLTMPVFEYSHQYGCAVLGGDVYRGTVWPELEGKYFFSDHCLGAIWSIQLGDDEVWRARSYGSFFYTHFTGMGMGQDGEMYIANRTLGRILRIGSQSLLLPESSFLPVTVR